MRVIIAVTAFHGTPLHCRPHSPIDAAAGFDENRRRISMSSGSTIANIKPTDLRGILKYVPRFQGQIFVIALDGAIVADDNFGNLLIDIAVLRSLGIKMVLVHGIGRQIEELSTARNIPISDVHGTGVTDAATLDLAIRASARGVAAHPRGTDAERTQVRHHELGPRDSGRHHQGRRAAVHRQGRPH